MDIQYYLTFREVAACGSFTRAGERLGYAQSTVTVQIQKLEKAYGAPLFERYGRTLRLTEAGVALSRYAEQITDAYNESLAVMQSPNFGTLMVGTIETLAAFFLPAYLQRFRNDYPGIALAVYPTNEREVLSRVKQGEWDVGLILDPLLYDPELETVMLREERLVIISGDAHPFAGKDVISIRDFEKQSMILTERTCTYRAAMEHAIADHKVKVNIVSELGSIEAIKQCVRAGLGAALLPYVTVEAEVKRGELHISKPDPQWLPPFYTQLVISRKKKPALPLRRLLELLQAGGGHEQEAELAVDGAG
ncbi:LysR family transcriptional regulator [Paenibacillus tarimensis]|uniref:LysR family transcriptional regulator n=1 Tax=Paenibacillus tarimensis TaxID=416012 RepID=UPI001F2D9B20|nr:LysR family transcriptional regulator [Paenibacillus tarimensis]MCF2944333.1 LysR family transcriptional regulator [Paenibacillus tarimensis]